jgi:hypothetical protein
MSTALAVVGRTGRWLWRHGTTVAAYQRTAMDIVNTPAEVAKTQAVRVADVFVIGPLMVFGGLTMPCRPLGWLLVAFGVGTVVYNGRNYRANQRNAQFAAQ